MPAQDFIGLTGPEYEMDVERGAIRNYAKASHAPIPAYLEGRNPVIPPTFLITAGYTWGYTMERPRGTVFETIDHDFSVPLHAEESFEFHAPLPRAGDRLRCVSSVENVTTKTGSQGGDLTFLVMLTTYHDEAGALVAEQRSTTVTTTNAPDEGAWDVAIPTYEPHYDTIDGTDPLAGLCHQSPNWLWVNARGRSMRGRCSCETWFGMRVPRAKITRCTMMCPGHSPSATPPCSVWVCIRPARYPVTVYAGSAPTM